MGPPMRIAIIGAGYVGLVTGACLAKLGNEVVFVDSNKEKIDTLRRRECPICEEGLSTVVVYLRRRVYLT